MVSRFLVTVALLGFLLTECAFAQTAAITQRSLDQQRKEKKDVDARLQGVKDAIAFIEAKMASKPPPLLVLQPGYNDIQRMNFRNPAEQAILPIRLEGLRGDLRRLEDQSRLKSEKIATLENTLAKQGGKAVLNARSMDLLKEIGSTPKNVKGRWRVDDSGKLVSAKERNARIELPGRVPQDYRLTIKGRREEGRDCLAVVLPIAGKQTLVLIDGWGSTVNGIGNIDGVAIDRNASTVRKNGVLSVGQPFELVYLVQNGNIEVQVNGNAMLAWRNGADRLSLPVEWAIPATNQLGLGAYESVFSLSSITLEPL